MDTESRCNFFDSLNYRGGGSRELFLWTVVKVWSLGQFNTWPAYPPACAGNKVLDLLSRKKHLTDHLEWLSEMIFIGYYLNITQFCVHAYTLRARFLVTVGFIVVTIAKIWYII